MSKSKVTKFVCRLMAPREELKQADQHVSRQFKRTCVLCLWFLLFSCFWLSAEKTQSHVFNLAALNPSPSTRLPVILIINRSWHLENLYFSLFQCIGGAIKFIVSKHFYMKNSFSFISHFDILFSSLHF